MPMLILVWALWRLIWVWACGPVPEEAEIKARPQILFVSFPGEGCSIQECFVLSAVPQWTLGGSGCVFGSLLGTKVMCNVFSLTFTSQGEWCVIEKIPLNISGVVLCLWKSDLVSQICSMSDSKAFNTWYKYMFWIHKLECFLAFLIISFTVNSHFWVLRMMIYIYI